MLIVAVWKNNLDNTWLDDVELSARLANVEQSFPCFKELLLRPVEQLSQDVLVCISKEFYVVLA